MMPLHRKKRVRWFQPWDLSWKERIALGVIGWSFWVCGLAAVSYRMWLAPFAIVSVLVGMVFVGCALRNGHPVPPPKEN